MNWIKGAIKRPGALHRTLGVPEGQKIPEKKIEAAKARGGRVGREAKSGRDAIQDAQVKFRPIQDRVIVRLEAQKSAAGIELPPSATGPHRHGVVEAAGDGMRFMDGQLHALRCKAGDQVVFEGGEDIRLDGQIFVLLREAQVIGILGNVNEERLKAAIAKKQHVEADAA